MGMHINSAGYVLQDSDIGKQRYPYFELADYDEYTKEILENDFKDILNYMIGREEFVDIFSYGTIDINQYKNALSYINKNGVKEYEVYVIIPKDDIIKLMGLDIVNHIIVDDVKLSMYSK